MGIQYIQYNENFVRDVIGALPDALINFYNEQHDSGRLRFSRSLQDAIKDILEENFQGTMDLVRIQGIFRKKHKYMNKKKKRWAENVIGDAALQIDDKKYPFKEEVVFKVNSSPKEWYDRYGDMDFYAVVADRIEDVSKWAKPDTYMVDFPCRSRMTDGAMYSSFEMDVVCESCRIMSDMIKHAKDGLKPYVMDIEDAPFFTNTSRKRYGREDTQLVTNISEDKSELLVTDVGQKFFDFMDYYKAMDLKDQEFISYFIDKASENMIPSTPIRIRVNDLGKILCGTNNPSQRDRQDAINRCFKLAHMTHRKIVDGRLVAVYNFVDSVALVDNDVHAKELDIVVGSIISNAILENKILRIPADAYKKLNSGMARLLYMHLQKRRIFAQYRASRMSAVTGQDSFMHGYREKMTYNDFSMFVNFISKRKLDNFQMICDALQEYVDNGDIIAGFISDFSSFSVEIEFLPMNKDEMASMQLYNGNILLESLDV